MFHSINRRLVLQITRIKHSTLTETATNEYFPLLQKLLFIKSISSISNPIDTAVQTSFTVSYLINSCGLSPESALSASKKINLEKPERPDSVLTFLKQHGFMKTHITRIITKQPQLLLASPEKSLKPKVDFFNRSGVSGDLLVYIIASNPSLFKRSIKNQLTPSFNLLKSFFKTDRDFIAALRRSTQVLLYNIEEAVIPNVSILRDHGVSEHWISNEIVKHARTLSLMPDRFSEIVKAVGGMGFDRSSSMFMIAVRVMASMVKSTWDGKMEIYRSFGWSDDDILSAFKKQPFCMVLSDKKQRRILEFFMSKMGMSASIICQYPNALLFSLENRIIPRFAVMQLLMSKSVIKVPVTLYAVLVGTELNFLSNFVTKYEEVVPEVVTAYEGKREYERLERRSDKSWWC